MTLIAIAAAEDRASILTDTWSYTRSGRDLGRASKVLPVPHLEMVTVTQGDCSFGRLWSSIVPQMAQDVADFDGFLAAGVSQVLRDAYAFAGGEARVGEVAVFVVGWSPTASRFRAVGYSSYDGFAEFELQGLFVHPSPLSLRPHDLELARFDADVAKAPRPGDAENRAVLTSLPTPTRAPASPEEWAQLALEARQRSYLAVSTRLKVFVGGSAMLTELERGFVGTAKLFDFDDSAEEMARIMNGTLHPIGQAGPCPCGSGERYRDCCIAKALDETCYCGSGETLGACCAEPVSEATFTR